MEENMEVSRGRIGRGMLGRARGCLYGQVAGDNLGALVEFRPAEEIARSHPGGLRELVSGGVWNILAGQPTDDSEMALAMARSILREGGWKRGAVLAAYVGWLGSHPFDCGATIGCALRGVPSPSSQSNGALMRESPLAVYGALLDEAALAALAREDASLTNANRTACQASELYVVLLADAIRTGDAPEVLYGRMEERARAMGAAPMLLRLLEDARTERPGDFMEKMGWLKIALQNAFWHLLHTGDAAEAVSMTAASGGDTDTNAAICGALMGAVHGEDALPEQWRNAVDACRAEPGSLRPRPADYWPADAGELAGRLLLLGAEAQERKVG